MYCSRGTTLFVFLSSRSPLQYRSVSEKDHSFRVPVLHGNSPSLLLAFACWTWKTFFRGPLAMRFRDGSSFRSCTSYRIAAGSQSRTLSVSAGQTYTVVDVNNSTRFAKCQLDFCCFPRGSGARPGGCVGRGPALMGGTGCVMAFSFEMVISWP